MSIHFHKLAIKDIRRETPESISVSFDLPEEVRPVFEFIPGQNITVRTYINDSEIRRSYSICSSPYDNELRIAVKETAGGVFSTWANKQLAKGQFLEVLPPTGHFTVKLDPKQRKNYLAIAAGSGITPVLSIIRSVLYMEPQSSCTLIFGNRSRATIMFREQLMALKNNFMSRFAIHNVLSREITDADIYSGRITALKCEEFSGQLIDFTSMDKIFLCGPETMIFDIRDWLFGRNISAEKIHYELFITPVLQRENSAAKAIANTQPELSKPAGNSSSESFSAKPAYADKQISEVTVKLDGISFDFKLAYEGETILEAALRQGADLPFSCKGGVCSTCRAKLIDGEIKMDLNYALEQEEVEAGFILCCQSHPQSSRVVIDFDQK